MFRDLLAAFTGLFTERRSRLEVSGLLVVMAMLPVSELLVTRLFSHLVLDGAERVETDRAGLVLACAGFFAAFAASRAVHHVVRLNRVRVFRRGFESSQQARPRQHGAWGWAAAFELSTASVALIQVLAFSLLFLWLDPVFGALNLGIGASVLALVAAVYRRQLAHQLSYLAGQHGASTEVGERVGRRLRDAELGAVLASLAMAVALALVLLRAVSGALAAADAIVLFLGLRMMYGQVGHLSASAMRFARVRARLDHGRSTTAEPDDGEDDGLGGADDGPTDLPDEDGDPDARAAAGLRGDGPTPHRDRVVREMLLAGQAGDLTEVRSYATRIGAGTATRRHESDAVRVAEAFALLAAPSVRREALPVTWWPRPFPGSAANWLLPTLVRRLSGHPVSYQKPGALTDRRHLVVGGSLLGVVQPSSIVVGAGVLGHDVSPDPRARYVSVRGPLSADAVCRAGGPTVDLHGDPLVLAARLLPVARRATNGRLALVRHASQHDLPVLLPDDVDEVDARVARPDDLLVLVASLATYDGVVTSDPGVVALCRGYGLPCAPVALEERPDLDLVLRDQGRGLGLADQEHPLLGPDLRAVRLVDLLHDQAVASEVLDALEDHLVTAVALCREPVAAT